MIFSLDVRRARKGDCLLLHFGSKDEPGLVLIDGGPRDVYKPHLRPRIEQIRDARGLSENDSLIVDLLMVSHVDDDHIQGILDLTRDELVAKGAGRSRLLNVLSLWHNSFDEIIGHKPTELTASVRSHFGAAAISGGSDLPEDKKIEVEEKSVEDKEVVTSALKVLASIEQGFRLRQDAAGLGYERNPDFDGKLIIARVGGKPVKVGEGLKFLVVGPMQAEVEALFKRHQEWLKDLASSGKSPPEALAAYIDKSVPNLSSIVVLAEAGGKRMLLTGDARGDKIWRAYNSSAYWNPEKAVRFTSTCSRSHTTAAPIIWTRISSSGSQPITTSSLATVSTATRSETPWTCSLRRVARHLTRSILPTRSRRSMRRARGIGKRSRARKRCEAQMQKSRARRVGRSGRTGRPQGIASAPSSRRKGSPRGRRSTSSRKISRTSSIFWIHSASDNGGGIRPIWLLWASSTLPTTTEWSTPAFAAIFATVPEADGRLPTSHNRRVGLHDQARRCPIEIMAFRYAFRAAIR